MGTATKQGMSLAEGLALARASERKRVINRWKQQKIEGELAEVVAELAAEGVAVTISASELVQLEQAGLVYEFATGLVQVEQP